MGAQWIHGQEGNVLYAFAEEHGLLDPLAVDCGAEGVGTFCREDGEAVGEEEADLIAELVAYLDEAKDLETIIKAEDEKEQLSPPANMHEHFKAAFDRFRKSHNPPLSVKDEQLLKMVVSVVDNLKQNPFVPNLLNLF